MNDWNDPAFLKSTSVALQWVILVLVFLVGGLLLTKNWIDRRERRLSSAVFDLREISREQTERDLRARLAHNDERIARLDLEITVDVLGKWKDGKAPDSAEWLVLAAESQSANIDFVLANGETVSTSFFRAEGLKYEMLPGDVLRITYRAALLPGAPIYAAAPGDIREARNVRFLSYLHRGMVREPAVSVQNVKVLIFINGVPRLTGSARTEGQVELHAQNQPVTCFVVGRGMNLVPP